ncbi:alpha/beta hydrolase [Kitasatospora sp. NPDC050543]|uniref:alpha/beta hydrolase n=1 Tax=Kitasatospora sp. NPDC050543 TaxID=3364054 RepID=UPI0037B57E66
MQDKNLLWLVGAAEPAKLHAAADAWDALAEKYFAHSRDWAANTQQRVLNSGWTGEAAEAARTELEKWEGQLKACQRELDTIGTTMRTAADRLTMFKLQRQAIHDQARADELTINELVDGPPHVTIDLAAYGEESPQLRHDPDYQDGMTKGAARRRELLSRIEEFEKAVREADDDYAGTLEAAADTARLAVVDDRYSSYQQEQAQKERRSVLPDAVVTNSDPKAVKQWWDSLPPEVRQQLLKDYPELGNTDGIPAQDRDTANRLHLPEVRAEMERELAAPQPAQWASRTKLDSLVSLQEQLDSPSTPPRMLLGLGDPAGTGSATNVPAFNAIVAYGNPDKAKNVAAYVPPSGGLDKEFVSGDLEFGKRLNVAANQADPKSPTATVVWMNYDAPPRVASTSISMTGGGASSPNGQGFNQFLNGVRTTHDDGPPPRLTAIGTGAYEGTIHNALDTNEGCPATSVVINKDPDFEDRVSDGFPKGQSLAADPNDPAYFKAAANVVTGHGDRNNPVVPQ